MNNVNVTRRGFVAMGVGTLTLAALASCAVPARFVNPSGAPVRAAELARHGSGRVTKLNLVANETQIDLAGVSAKTWGYGSTLAPVVRMTAGDTLRATVRNQLPKDTSVHWHGLALRNDMDGVPGVTQKAIGRGQSFTYDFIAPNPGTYWFHPHVGVQLDRALYGALIVEDAHEPLSYDDEWVVILDDWLDGVSGTPDDVLKNLSGGMAGMMGGGMTMSGARSVLLGGDAGDVVYPYFLINGHPSADPETYLTQPGKRVRIRLINAGGDTAFRVALGGHQLTVTHTDGYPVTPVVTDSLLIGMGERYDVVVTVGDGAFPFVAQAEGKQGRAFAIVRSSTTATAPDSTVNVAELDQRVLTSEVLRADASVSLPTRKVDRELTATMSGSMMAYDWAINGHRFNPNDPMAGAMSVTQKERVRLVIRNTSKMWHPFHLHGHTFQLSGGGPRKDTSIILPGRSLTVEFDADNPGLWAAHCHNIYHAEAGMMTVVGYTA